MFLSFAILIVLFHLKNIEYYVDIETNDNKIEVYQNDFDVTVFLNNENDEFLIVNLWFNNLTNNLFVKNINLKIDNVKMIKVRRYQGMLSWEPVSFNSFSDIPDSLRYISKISHDYHAFDHFFQKVDLHENHYFEIEMDILEKGIQENISKKVLIKKIDKIEFKMAHGDATVLFIPLFGLIGLLLLTIVIIRLVIRKNKKRLTKAHSACRNRLYKGTLETLIKYIRK